MGIKELSAFGQADFDGLREARALVLRYDKKARAMRRALEKRDVARIATLLEVWEFDHADPLVKKAQCLLLDRSEQLVESHTVAAPPAEGPRGVDESATEPVVVPPTPDEPRQ